MRYADRQVCPDCRGGVQGQQRCPTCGLDLTSTAVRNVWQALESADAWVVEARRTSGAPAAPAPAATPVVPRVRAAPRINAGQILLALGALCILVAGLIFLVVQWGSLGVTGRALVMLAFTAVVGLVAQWVTLRGLRASAEALWTVFLGLVTLDWFSARSQGLFALDEVDAGLWALLWGGLIAALGIAVVRSARPRVASDLLAPSIIAGLGPLVAGIGAGEWLDSTTDVDAFWSATAALAAAGLLTYVFRVAGPRVAWLSGLGACGLFGVVATALALVQAVEHPELGELASGEGLPLLVAAAAALVGAVRLPILRPGLGALALIELGTLVVLPADAARPGEAGHIAAAVLVVVLAAVGTLDRPALVGWLRAVRLAASVGTFGLVVASAPWLGHTLWALANAAEWGRDLGPWDVVVTDGPHRWGIVAALGVGTAAATWFAARWPEFRSWRTWGTPVTGLVLLVTVLVVIAAVHPSPLALGLPLAVVAAPIAPVFATASWVAAAVVAVVSALVLVVVTRRFQTHAWAAVPAGLAAFWGAGAVVPVVLALELDDRPATLAVVLAALVGLAASVAVSGVLRIGVEAGIGAIATAGLLWAAAETSEGWLALLTTLLGVTLVLVGLFDARRRGARWVGSLVLVLAWGLRMAASDVEQVEAYTLPLAAVLLVAGYVAMRGRPELGTLPALSAGLTLALVPSLPQVLETPASLRALLLGLGAAACVGLGVVQRWRAPFVAGAATLALVVVAEIGPWVFGLERWVLIAVVGTALLAVGITWEQRIRDGRAAVRYVESMR